MLCVCVTKRGVGPGDVKMDVGPWEGYFNCRPLTSALSCSAAAADSQAALFSSSCRVFWEVVSISGRSHRTSECCNASVQ